MGAERRGFAIEHVQGGRALSVEVTGGFDGWAASTPSGIVDGRFARPWALALQSPGDRALFDISPFMAEARAPGMVPALLRDGLPPACSVDLHAWRRPQATPVPSTNGMTVENPRTSDVTAPEHRPGAASVESQIVQRNRPGLEPSRPQAAPRAVN